MLQGTPPKAPELSYEMAIAHPSTRAAAAEKILHGLYSRNGAPVRITRQRIEEMTAWLCHSFERTPLAADPEGARFIFRHQRYLMATEVTRVGPINPAHSLLCDDRSTWGEHHLWAKSDNKYMTPNPLEMNLGFTTNAQHQSYLSRQDLLCVTAACSQLRQNLLMGKPQQPFTQLDLQGTHGQEFPEFKLDGNLMNPSRLTLAASALAVLLTTIGDKHHAGARLPAPPLRTPNSALAAPQST